MNGYRGARVLLLSKRAQEKGGGGVCLCVYGAVCLCVCVCVSVLGGLGVHHIQRLTNLLFSQDLYKKKQNDD